MRSRKLEKFIYEHTELFSAEEGIFFARSAADAQKILDSKKCASFATTLRRAMALADMSDETRAMAQRMLKKAERKERRHSPEMVLRRRAVIAAIAVAMLSFFTLFPQGRAIAKSVIDWVVTFFDNGIIIIENRENIDPNIISSSAGIGGTPPPIESGVDVNTVDDTEHYYYDSIEEFVQEFGKNPLILDNPDATLKSLRYDKDEEIGLYALISIYDYKGHEFFLLQDWSDTGSSSAYYAGTDEYFYKDYLDKQIICSINPKTGNLDGLLILDDSIVTLSIDNSPENELLFEQIRLYHP